MTSMTTTYPELLIETVVSDPAFHTLAEVAIIISLVAVLVMREMVRHRHVLLARAVVPSLTALAVPLAIAWTVIAIERFVELAGL